MGKANGSERDKMGKANGSERDKLGKANGSERDKMGKRRTVLKGTKWEKGERF